MEGSLAVAIPSIALGEMSLLAASHSSLYEKTNDRGYTVILLTLFCGHQKTQQKMLWSLMFVWIQSPTVVGCSRGLLECLTLWPLHHLPW